MYIRQIMEDRRWQTNTRLDETELPAFYKTRKLFVAYEQAPVLIGLEAGSNLKQVYK